jgi:hypothetical protein
MKASQVAILFALLAVLASLVSMSSARAWDNLLQNPGFEEDIEHWQASTGSLSVTDSPQFVHSGNFAAKFTSNDAITKWIYQVISIQGSEAYTFSGYALINDGDISSIRLRIRWYEGQGGFGNQVGEHMSSLLMLNSPDYQSLEISAALAPPTAQSARAEVILEPASSEAAIAYFDDMSFTGPPPPTPMPTPSPSSTPTPSPSPSPALTPTPSPTLADTTANEGDVVINEVQYDPPQSGPDASFEWVELFNRTAEPIDLEGWRIRDNRESDSIPSLLLPPNGFAVIAATEEGFHDNFYDFDGSIVFIQGPIGNGLSNDGDCIILEDSEGRVIDALSYGDDDTIMSPPCPDVDAGHSLERSPPGGGFSDNPDPTPGFGPSPAPTPTETPVETQTPTIAPTETPTAPPPGGATTESSGGSGFSGMALRGVGIALAITLFGILFWVTRRRGSRK